MQAMIFMHSNLNNLIRGATFHRNSTKVWKALGSRYSDGWLYANNLDLTGQNIVYIYEDFQTAIMGQFKGGKFINGTAAKIAANRYALYFRLILLRLLVPFLKLILTGVKEV